MNDTLKLNPRENCDHLSVMACWKRNSTIGDVQPSCSPKEWMEEKENVPKGSVVLNIFIYEHSGIVLSSSPFGDPWDSGQLGFMVMTPDKILEGWGQKKDGKTAKRVSAKMQKQALECMKAELEEYNKWIQGQCWGWSFTDENGKEDSCWGYICDDEESAQYMKESMPEEARALFAEAWEKRE